MAERLLSVRLKAVVDGYERAMGRAVLATDKVTQAGKKLEDSGRKITLGFSLPMIGAGGAALKTAIDFESAFTGVRKTVDGTTAQMEMLEKGIIHMSREVPSTTEDISAVAEAAGQLGIEIPNILDFTRVMIDLGNAAADVSAEDAAMSLAQFAVVTQMNQKNFDRLGSSIAALGNNSETTEGMIIEMSQRLAGAGKQIGMTEAEILGFATALASVGMEAQAGGTAMSKIMIEVAKAVSLGGKELDLWADAAGMAAAEFAQLFGSDSAAAMSALVAGLGDVSAAGGDLFGILESLGVTEARTRDSLLRLAGSGDKFTKSIKISTDAWEENTALADEAALRYGTTASQLAIARNRIREVAREAGEALVPVLLATLGVVDPLVGGVSRLIEIFSSLPAPIQMTAGGLMAIAVASGPAIWGLGKLMALYKPLTLAVGSATRNIQYMVSSINLMAASRGVSFMTALTGVTKASGAAFLAASGPMLAVVAAIAAIGAAWYVTNRANKEAQRSFTSASDAAVMLANSADLATNSLRSLNEESDKVEPPISDMEFAADNSDIIKTLKEMADYEEQLNYLKSIGYGMVLRGVDPEEAFEQIKRLADIELIEIPITFTFDDLGDWDNQITYVRDRVQSALEGIRPAGAGTVVLRDDAKRELDAVAKAAADAFATDNIDGFAQIIGETLSNIEHMPQAVDHFLSAIAHNPAFDEAGISTMRIKNWDTFLEQLETAPGIGSKTQQALTELAAAMEESGETSVAAALLWAASGESAQEASDAYAGAANEAADGAGGLNDFDDAMDDSAASAEELAAALEQVAQNTALSRLEWDAGVAAAQSFADALDRTSRLDNRMGAGLGLGGAFKRLNEGLTGTKRNAEEAAESTDDLGQAVERMSSRARQAGERVGGFEFRMQALAAAGKAFRESIETSSRLDEQIESALSLGSAYEQFRRTYRRLPAEIDMVDMATGKLRKRQAEAVQNTLALGKAAMDYLGTLIEMGKTEGQVQGEAKRMRDEYHAMFLAMGMTTEQANKYIEAMGLLPSQITTAIELSGIELARFQLQTYIDLLEGKIPDSLAVEIIAMLDRGEIDGAAQRLANFAKSNPALIEVGVDGKKGARDVKKLKDELWQLPKVLDPVKAALGEYTDAEQSALEAVMAFGDGVSSYLSAVAHDRNVDEIRDQAYQIRDAFMSQLEAFGIVGAEAEAYAELIGLTDWQIETAITVSGVDMAMFKIDLYMRVLDGEIPREVMTEVMAMLREDDLDGVAKLLEKHIADIERDARIELAIDTVFKPMAKTWAIDPFTNPSSYSTGGLVRGPGSTTSDSIPTMLSDREFVINAAKAGQIGYENLEYMNRTGVIPGTEIPHSAFGLNTPSTSTSSVSHRTEHIDRSIHLDVTVPSVEPHRAVREIVRAGKSGVFHEIGGL